MIKRLRVTVDGNTYDVTVEMTDDQPGPSPAPLPPPAVSAPASTPPPAPVAPSAPAAPPVQPAAAGQGEVPSPLAGRVTAVVVTMGQSVKEGDHLLTLEAMKMNTFVFSPKTGTVAEIKTAVSDAVEENQILMRIG